MLIGMQTDTTIRVTRELRARISAAAKAEGVTVNLLLDGLMADYERSQRMAAAALAMQTASPEVLEEYMREFRQWEGAALRDLRDR